MTPEADAAEPDDKQPPGEQENSGDGSRPGRPAAGGRRPGCGGDRRPRGCRPLL